MKFEILGPLRVFDQGRYTSISARKIETLLAVLLIRREQVVSTEQLITEIWGAHPPRRVTAALYVYISQLRKFLHRSGRPTSLIETRSPGYVFHSGSDEVDFDRFQRLVDEGRAGVRSQDSAATTAAFEKALSLWRGPVLTELRDGPIISGFVAWVEQIRLECLEMTVSSGLMLGRHRELVGQLYSLVDEYPLHEEFYCQLMLALHRSGRRADALKVYRTARDTLRDELGLEPSRTLRQLQRSVLVADGEPEPVALLGTDRLSA